MSPRKQYSLSPNQNTVLAAVSTRGEGGTTPVPGNVRSGDKCPFLNEAHPWTPFFPLLHPTPNLPNVPYRETVYFKAWKHGASPSQVLSAVLWLETVSPKVGAEDYSWKVGGLQGVGP